MPLYVLLISIWAESRLTSLTARARDSPSVAKIVTQPESSWSMSSWQPVYSVMRLMFLPPGPMSAPILSDGILMRWVRGAQGFSSARVAGMVLAMMSRIASRETLFWAMASLAMLIGRPWILRSSWKAVMPSRVPQILKSMSP